MKKIQNKKILVSFLVLGVAILISSIVLIKNNSTNKNFVRVIDREFGIACTADVPTSSCGGFEVTVESKDGVKSKYQVPGFDNRERQKFDEITSKINKSKDENSYLTLEINNKGEVISAE